MENLPWRGFPALGESSVVMLGSLLFLVQWNLNQLFLIPLNFMTFKVILSSFVLRLSFMYVL